MSNRKCSVKMVSSAVTSLKSPCQKKFAEGRSCPLSSNSYSVLFPNSHMSVQTVRANNPFVVVSTHQAMRFSEFPAKVEYRFAAAAS